MSVSPTSSTLESGQTLQLNKTIDPSTATEEVQWTSSNTSVATVSNSHLLLDIFYWVFFEKNIFEF